jgi:hypothetical protein
VQQLQRWLRVQTWLHDAITTVRHLSGWAIQSRWRDGVHQLQRRLRVSDGRRHERHCDDVWRRLVQRRRRDCVQHLQCRVRVPACIDECESAVGDVSSWHFQCLWRGVMQQLQCRLRVSCRVDERDAGGSDMPSREVQRVGCDDVQQLQRWI